MIATIAFKKFGKGVFVAHTDILRCLIRTFRRAGLEMNYSNGYNKHMIVKLTQPLPFGIGSEEDWVTIDLAKDYEKEELLRLFNDNCPPFLRGYDIFILEKNPNLSALVVGSEYFLPTAKAMEKKEEIIKAVNFYSLHYVDKTGAKVDKDVTDMIFDIKVCEEGLSVKVAFGMVNLRIDLLSEQFNRDFGLGIEYVDIVRTRQLIRVSDRLIGVKEYLSSL